MHHQIIPFINNQNPFKMKQKFLIGAMLLGMCFTIQNVNAQLEVLTSGDVIMSKRAAVNGASVSNTIALNVEASSHSSNASTYGVYSYIKQSHPLLITSGSGVGVFGRTLPYSGMSSLDRSDSGRPSSSPFYAGVAGMSYSFGVGIYGTTSSSLPLTWSEGNYAGYFNGNVKITGTLTTPSVALAGDIRLQENVTQLNSRNSVDLLSRLNPVSFTFKTDNTSEDTPSRSSHYGFVAQEVKEIAPELVIEDGAGYLSVNYVELIPLLVQKVQELSAEVTELKAQAK